MKQEDPNHYVATFHDMEAGVEELEYNCARLHRAFATANAHLVDSMVGAVELTTMTQSLLASGNIEHLAPKTLQRARHSIRHMREDLHNFERNVHRACHQTLEELDHELRTIEQIKRYQRITNKEEK